MISTQDGETAATTLLSEIDYERCLRDFQDAFEKGHLTEFWVAVENRLTQALEQAEAEGALPQICLLYTSPSPRDYAASRMPSSA